MAEKIVSPGVFTDEIDQSFLPAAVADIGAVVVGPTVKGPALIPTVVTSYSEYQAIFGDSFKSGSQSFQFLTSHTAENYLKHSNKLTVVRIMDGTTHNAVANVVTGSNNIGTTANLFYTGSAPPGQPEDLDKNVSFRLWSLTTGAIMNNSGSGRESANGGSDFSGSNNILKSGSKDNIRWEVSNTNHKKGTFTLNIRRGDDTEKRKQVLETFNNVSLDPNTNNYISKVIGDSYFVMQGTESEPYLQLSGSYGQKSKYVRVEVIKATPDYLDENGDVRIPAQSSSLPGLGSGSRCGTFDGGDNGWSGFDALGNISGDEAEADYDSFYEKIGAKSQGFDPATDNEGKTAYVKAINLLSNQDEYDFNLVMLPGLEQVDHSAVITKAIDMCEDRGDCFVIADPVAYGSTLSAATDEAGDYDSNYAAMYWPWVQVPDNQVGTSRWVPPSVVMGGIFAFNDKVAHPWFAPAGLNRGGIDTAIQAERKLTQSNRDDLYDNGINPIATFPGQGVTVFGQKTLQKKSSALDRINVRRLLIRCKKFIASASRFLVFEQNTAATRRRFLNIVNPFLEQVQSQSGLNAFRVVMDETNNTPDSIDRNILYGQIFLQPTRTAEFVVLDFTVQPTGATFPE